MKLLLIINVIYVKIIFPDQSFSLCKIFKNTHSIKKILSPTISIKLSVLYLNALTSIKKKKNNKLKKVKKPIMILEFNDL